MRNLIIILCIIFTCLHVSGQNRFSKTYHYVSPDDTARTEGMRALIEIPGEGYMFTNCSWNYFTGDSKFIVTKVNLNGDIIFTKTYGDSGFYYASESIAKTYDGNFILSMSQSSYLIPGDNAVAGLIKINPLGDTLWTKYFSSGLAITTGRTAIETSDRGFALAGWTAASSTSADQLILIKTDSLGNKLWEKQYGGSLKEDTRSIIETPDKGFMIAGWTTSYGAGYTDGYLIKTDSFGNQLWQKTYGGTSFAEGFETIIPLMDGNYLLTGNKCLGPGISDNGQGWLVKIDPTGAVIWQKNYGTPNNDGFLAGKELSDASIIIAASTWDTVSNSWDCWLLKLNSAGDTLWSRIYGYPYYIPNSDDYFFDVVPTQDGGFAFGGFCQGPTGTQDAWLLKVDNYGCDSAGCQIVGIDERQELEIDLNLYPNPASNQITIEFDISNLTSITETKNVFLEIKNVVGQTVYFESIKNTIGRQSKSVDLSSLSNGFYILRLKNYKGSISKKFMKQ